MICENIFCFVFLYGFFYICSSDLDKDIGSILNKFNSVIDWERIINKRDVKRKVLKLFLNWNIKVKLRNFRGINMKFYF